MERPLAEYFPAGRRLVRLLVVKERAASGPGVTGRRQRKAVTTTCPDTKASGWIAQRHPAPRQARERLGAGRCENSPAVSGRPSVVFNRAL